MAVSGLDLSFCSLREPCFPAYFTVAVNSNNLCVSSFYYIDERTENGQPAMSTIDGPAHGEFCFELAQSKIQGPWDATFVKGIGHKDFESVTTRH